MSMKEKPDPFVTTDYPRHLDRSALVGVISPVVILSVWTYYLFFYIGIDGIPAVVSTATV